MNLGLSYFRYLLGEVQLCILLPLQRQSLSLVIVESNWITEQNPGLISSARDLYLDCDQSRDISPRLMMRFTTKVTSHETTVTKSVPTEEKFTFSVKKSEGIAGTSGPQRAVEDANGGASLQKSSTLNVNREKIEDFASVRAKIFPVVKARSWVETTKDLLTKINPESKEDVLYVPLKSIPGSGLGYTLAIIDNESPSLNHILSSYLEAWRTSENALQEIALKNLEQKLASVGNNLWVQSKAGVFYTTGLGSLSASVVLLPQYISRLDLESGDAVVTLPSSDLCMVVGSKMETQLCIVGELSLRYSSDPHHLNTSLRLNKQRMTLSTYAPRSYAGEFAVPSTLDEVAGLKMRLKPLKRKK